MHVLVDCYVLMLNRVCACMCACACVCVHVCVHMCAGVVSKDASQVSAYLDSDGLLRIGVLLKEGDPCYR